MFHVIQKGQDGAVKYAQAGGWNNLTDMMTELGITLSDVDQNFWLTGDEVEFAGYLVDEILVASYAGRRFYSVGVEAPRFHTRAFISDKRFDEVFN